MDVPSLLKKRLRFIYFRYYLNKRFIYLNLAPVLSNCRSLELFVLTFCLKQVLPDSVPSLDGGVIGIIISFLLAHHPLLWENLPYKAAFLNLVPLGCTQQKLPAPWVVIPAHLTAVAKAALSRSQPLNSWEDPWRGFFLCVCGFVLLKCKYPLACGGQKYTLGKGGIRFDLG